MIFNEDEYKYDDEPAYDIVFMEDVDALEESIQKNITELCEYIVNFFDITNYYDLIDLLERYRKNEK